MGKQHYRWVVFGIVLLLVSVYFFVFSKSGLLERIVLDKEKNRIAATIETLKSENNWLQRLLNQYRRGDYPESVMAESGYVKNGGGVLYFQGIDAGTPGRTEKAAPAADYPVPLPYLRMAWIGISSIVIVSLVLYGRKLSDQSS